MKMDPDTAIGGQNARFPSTRRSIVEALASDDSQERERAYDLVTSLYWKPLYKYLRLKWNKSNEEAKDLTQGFFAIALEKRTLDHYDSKRGTFRTYLRTLFDRFLANEAKSAGRIKRGGGEILLDFESAELEISRQSVAEATSMEDFLYREWMRSLFTMSVEQLQLECQQAGKEWHFELFEAYDLDPIVAGNVSYRDLAMRFAVTEATVTNHLAAVRRRFRQLVLDKLRQYTATEKEFRSEYRSLLGTQR